MSMGIKLGATKRALARISEALPGLAGTQEFADVETVIAWVDQAHDLLRTMLQVIRTSEAETVRHKERFEAFLK